LANPKNGLNLVPNLVKPAGRWPKYLDTTMKRVKYISHKSESDINDIKALALYFDHIDIVEQNNIHFVAEPDAKVSADGFIKTSVIETRDYTSDNFILHLKNFEEQKVISYSKHIVNPAPSPPGMLSMSENTIINNLIITENLLGESKEFGRKLDKNGNTIIEMGFALNTESIKISRELFPNSKGVERLLIYYSRLLRSYFDNIEKGESTITTSRFLNNLHAFAIKNEAFGKASIEIKKELNVSPYIAFEAIKLNVPNLGIHPTDEILEFRLKSNDELTEFRKALETLTIDIFDKYDDLYISKNAQKLVDLKVQPKLDEIKNKLKESKFKGFQQTVQEIKDPKSYSPLLLTLSENISNTMALMVSLGLISINVALEYYRSNKEYKKDGVQYLLKLNKYFG
jgi:hypothetical protein